MQETGKFVTNNILFETGKADLKPESMAEIQKVVVVPFSSVIKRYAKEKVATDRQGTPVADFDLLIGSSALENNLIMVTDNVKHFQPIPGITIENWIVR